MVRKLKDENTGFICARRMKRPASGGTFDTREAAEKHEREVQYFKRH